MPTNQSWAKVTSGSSFYIQSEVSSSPYAVAAVDSSTTEVLAASLASPVPSSQLFTSTADPSHTSYGTLQSGSDYMTVDSSTGLVYYTVSPVTIQTTMYWKYTALPFGSFVPESDSEVYLTLPVDDNGQPEIGEQLYVASALERGVVVLFSNDHYNGTAQRLLNTDENSEHVKYAPKSVRVGPNTTVEFWSEEQFRGSPFIVRFDRPRLPDGFTIKSYKVLLAHASECDVKHHEKHHEEQH